MPKGHRFRALVEKRPQAAAEELFCSEDENTMKQQVQYQVFNPNPGPVLNRDFKETSWIKEEPEEECITWEEEQLPMPFSEVSDVFVKKEVNQELTQGENISSDSDTDGHIEHSAFTHSDDWKHPIGSLPMEMETAPEASSTVHCEDMSHLHGVDEKNKHVCPFCRKGFSKNSNLQLHIRVHTGERPFTCAFCEKAFVQKGHLNAHLRTHTGEPAITKKQLAQCSSVIYHIRTQDREKPYGCSICKIAFAQKCTLDTHMRTHTGEKPFRCPICERGFSQKGTLNVHIRTHTGGKPFSCPTCNKAFAYKHLLQTHMGTHRVQSAEDSDMQSIGRILHMLRIPMQSI